jgi:hypothetical protein
MSKYFLRIELITDKKVMRLDTFPADMLSAVDLGIPIVLSETPKEEKLLFGYSLVPSIKHVPKPEGKPNE